MFRMISMTLLFLNPFLFSSDSLVKQLKVRQYAIVPIETKTEWFDEAIQAYDSFLKLPEEVKKKYMAQFFLCTPALIADID